jgi:hypothetical protein
MNLLPYDSIIIEALEELAPNNFHYNDSLLLIPTHGTDWILDFPNEVNTDVVVMHAQDYMHINKDGSSNEISLIEEFQQTHDIKTLVLVHWNHNLKSVNNTSINLVEFPSHSHDLVQDLIRSKDTWFDSVSNKTQSINYMCLNGIMKPHRENTYEYLKTLDIPAVVTAWQEPNEYDFPTYDDYNYNNVDNYISLIDTYRSTPVNIITESLYTEPVGIITEKTLFAFASLQLPILVAHKGAVKDAESYGFDMFTDIIDCSYDDLPNDIRWKSAIDLNMHILNGKFNYDDLLPRLKKNQEYLINGYLEFIETKLLTQLTSAVNN